MQNSNLDMRKEQEKMNKNKMKGKEMKKKENKEKEGGREGELKWNEPKLFFVPVKY